MSDNNNIEVTNSVDAGVELLNSRIKGIERDLELIDKKVKDLTDGAVKKQKDKILSKYNKDVQKEDDKIKKLKAERDKALAKGKAARIKEDTAELCAKNAGLKAEIKSILKINKMPLVCKTKLFLALFASKGIVDKLIFILLFLLGTCVLPYIVFMLLPTENTLVLAGIYCVFWTVISFTYLSINNKIKIGKWDAVKSIRACRQQISENNKNIRKIKKDIYTEGSDAAYDLASFDKQIGEAEAVIKGLTEEKDAAIAELENVTAKKIEREMAASTKAEREKLAKMLEEVTAELQKKDRDEK